MSCSVHDLSEYEAYGIPAVLVASEEFVSAAQAQGSALGTDPDVVYLPHPIQSRTDEEMAELADRFADEITDRLVEAPRQ